MTYNPNIPLATDDPSQSQSQIYNNFQTINTAFNQNHGNFNSASQGKHNFLQMPAQVSPPITAASEGGVYVSLVAGVPQLFYRQQSNGASYQITGSFTTGVTDGQYVLPGGLIVKWGFRSALMDNAQITYSTPFPNNVYNIQLTGQRGTANAVSLYVSQSGITTAKFNIRSSTTSGINVYFTAIGN